MSHGDPLSGGSAGQSSPPPFPPAAPLDEPPSLEEPCVLVVPALPPEALDDVPPPAPVGPVLPPFVLEVAPLTSSSSPSSPVCVPLFAALPPHAEASSVRIAPSAMSAPSGCGG
jgi:hypothetical protein